MKLLIILWIVGLSLIKVIGSDDVCISGTSWICECFNSLKTTHSIECCEDGIIRLERAGATILYEQINDTCKPSKEKSSAVKRDAKFRVNPEDKLNIYNSCSGKNRCNVTLNPSRNIKLQIPVTCEPETRIYNLIEDSPTNSTNANNHTNRYEIFYISGEDYIGREITYSCTATAKILRLEILYINLGPRSCKKVKMYSKGFPDFELVCTDSGMIMFYKDIGRIGTEFILEMKNLKLEKNEVIYLKLDASDFDINGSCHGNQKNTTENVEVLSTTENSKIFDKVGDETNLYSLFGGIIAALIVINIICIIIGVYFYRRNRKSPKNATTNESISKHEEMNSDYSHKRCVVSRDSQVTCSNYNNHELEIEDQDPGNDTSSQYDHIVANTLLRREATPVNHVDDYDHIELPITGDYILVNCNLRDSN